MLHVLIRKESGYCINDFVAIVQPIWNQLVQVDINKDHLHLIQVLMSLHLEYESMCVALLHSDPLPTFDSAINKILFEEIHPGLVKSSSSDVILAATHSCFPSGDLLYRNCRVSAH